MTSEKCVFCEIYKTEKRILYENNAFWTTLDKYPVSKGHALIISKKHVLSFFDLKINDLENLVNAITETKKLIDQQHIPDAYNIGINDGAVAGRTVHHLHIHLIPRYKGDVENPIGGVRNIIPGKGDYTKK